jgi:hypothetical protein
VSLKLQLMTTHLTYISRLKVLLFSVSVSVVWALQHFNFYARGSSKVNMTLDRYLLVPFLQGPLENLFDRMLAIWAKLINYNEHMIFSLGIRHLIPDTLGRRPYFKDWMF